MKNVLKSQYQEYRQHLKQFGYVVIDFLSEDKIAAIKKQFEARATILDSFFSNGIHMTTWIDDSQLKYKIKEELEENIKDACDVFFENYRLLNTTYIIKKKHKISNFPLHQDWSFVDETKHEALNLWVALQDTDEENGGLFIVKGSHKLNNSIRGAGDLSFNFEQYDKRLKKYLTPIQLKSGQAVLFYYSLIHGSPSNISNQPRVIISTSILPQDAPIILNKYDKENKRLLQYKVDDNFIYNKTDIRNDNGAIKEGKLINIIENYHLSEIKLEDIANIAVITKKSFFKRLFN